MLAVSTTRAATSLPSLARSLRKLHKSGGSRTIITRASSADTKQEQQASETSVPVQQQQQQSAAPMRRQQRRRGLLSPLGGGLLSPLGGGLLSPFGANLASPLSPLADIDYELNRALNELQSMQDMVFGHRDTVGRIPDKLAHDDGEEDVKLHVYERVYGKIERMFRLPDNADEEKIEASMKNGVLTVHVPKHPVPEEEEKKEPNERQIKIK